MKAGHQDFPPSRIFALTKSLQLPHVRSICINKPSDICRDEIWRLVKAASPQLHKLVLADCDFSVDRVEKVLQSSKKLFKSSLTIQTLGLYNYTTDRQDFSVLKQAALTRIASLRSLGLDDVSLSHKQLEKFYQHLGQQQHTEVRLSYLHCKSHGYSSCRPRLDLSASTELRRLRLLNLPVQDVVFVPDSLLLCYIGYLPDTVATSVIRRLHDAHSLEEFYCYSVRDSALVEFVRILSRLTALRRIFLWDIDLRGQQQIVLHHMTTLKGIYLYNITLTATQLQQLLAELPSHTVRVLLGDKDRNLPVTITDYDSNNDILQQLVNSPQTKVVVELQVTSERDQRIVKCFWFSHNK